MIARPESRTRPGPGALLAIGMLTFALGAFARSGPLHPLRLHLDWFPDAEFAGVFVAKEKGWYREEGLELELVPAGFDDMPKLEPGKAEIGIHSGQDLIRYVAKGEPLRVFAANYQSSPICLVVGQDSGIQTLKQLKGKTVGVFAPQDYDTLRIMLGHHGLSLKDIHIRRLKTHDEVALVRLLRKGEVHAIPAWEFNWTLSLPLLGYKVRVFPGYENGFHFYGIVYFARQDLIARHPELITGFLRATLRGWREVFRDIPAAARLIMEKYYPAERYVSASKELTLKQQTMELKLAQRFFFEGVGKDRMGWMSASKWRRSIAIARKYGIVPKGRTLEPKDVFDDSILRKVEQRR